jgi:hypothetical protein
MNVRVLVDIQTTKGTIPAGRIITIPDEVFGKLCGKVEVITDTPATDPATRIGKVLADIESRRPTAQHVDIWSLLSQVARERIQAATRAIDDAAPEELDVALTGYRQAWIEALAEIRPSEPPETCPCCKGHDFWQGSGKRVCRRCHPPAPDAEITSNNQQQRTRKESTP